MNGWRLICDCPTTDAMVCRDNPDCQPSYCKMKFYAEAQFPGRLTPPADPPAPAAADAEARTAPELPTGAQPQAQLE